MKKKSNLIIAVLIPIAVGAVSALLSRKGIKTYMNFNQPHFSPPAVVFPIVWTILYILMGISSYIIYISASPKRKTALGLYALQLAMNFCWSIIFFAFLMFLPAFIWLALMTGVIIAMIAVFKGISRAAAYINIPYLLWCCFALYLNWGAYILNR